jgi:hypothetical protein
MGPEGRDALVRGLAELAGSAAAQS